MDDLLPSPRKHDYGPKSFEDFLRLYLQYHRPKAECHESRCKQYPETCKCRKDGIAREGEW